MGITSIVGDDLGKGTRRTDESRAASWFYFNIVYKRTDRNVFQGETIAEVISAFSETRSFEPTLTSFGRRT